MPLYIQKVPLLPSAEFIEGNEKVSVQHPTHRAKVHVAMAIPLMRCGKISANSVQVTGPRVIAYTDMAATTRTTMSMPFISMK